MTNKTSPVTITITLSNASELQAIEDALSMYADMADDAKDPDAFKPRIVAAARNVLRRIDDAR